MADVVSQPTTLAQAVAATPDQVVAEASSVTTQVINSLMAGKSPFKSKTIFTSILFVVVGIGGVAWEAYQGAALASLLPFGVAIFSGCAMAVLRLVTNGPIVTSGLGSMMSTLLNLPAPPANTTTTGA